MDGRTLKQKLLEIKDARTTLNDIAEKMGIPPQNLQTWFAAADVKSGTIERMANILGVPPTAFYGDTITATRHATPRLTSTLSVTSQKSMMQTQRSSRSF